MIHVDKQVLSYLGIEKIVIEEAGAPHSCIPVFFFQEAWQLYCITELSPRQGHDKLLITYRGERLSVPVQLTGVRGKRRHYTAVFAHTLPLELAYKLAFLQSRFETADKRGERRLPVGVTYWKMLGLKQLYQTVLIDGYEYDCIIENIAEHGLLLSCGQEGKMNIRDPMALRLTFTAPSLISFLQLSPVRFFKKDGRLYIAVRIKEPLDIHYVMRLAHYVDCLTDSPHKHAVHSSL
ncbi:hypothetical protein [Treponema sp. OMZ 857]|uniref:hypothetical protein n=1 Tax=Treponema sp. OMZ 857 TaxID=1643513 RepID=UPI0020A294DD|nr:hypothetical protein [Treponema sp. OMZ 857]UTC44697.1 hypothetical protein E4N66_11770 [Treponema sp. OMZ 857]